MTFGALSQQANRKAYERDGKMIQQDRDSLNAVRHPLFSGWCWVQSHTVIGKDFHPAELLRPEFPPFSRDFSLKGCHVSDPDVARTRMPCPYLPDARDKLGK